MTYVLIRVYVDQILRLVEETKQRLNCLVNKDTTWQSNPVTLVLCCTNDSKTYQVQVTSYSKSYRENPSKKQISHLILSRIETGIGLMRIRIDPRPFMNLNKNF